MKEDVFPGVGFETALELVRRGAKVYLGCRNKQKGVAALQEIVAKSGCSATQVRVLELDLAFLKSVRKCAEDFLAAENQLDILVNNAGDYFFKF
jgi:NAD(P)-dependent dehydrogenase (short-subunit alcohol dehydrogenase family)